ncbi:PREDICTED: nucleoporin GLE1 [Papilio polytes]|uniref:nucleoporin GLE1 n=1 Tax=Papilio polytes TaxID=76194 RepID=UPI00067630B5|nr:PREDICTED: nucleoporin GLE1 [Papilio polytes]
MSDISVLSDFENSYNIIDNLSRENIKHDISISDPLAGFEKLRISALTKAAEISPMVKEVTIGPKSPLKNTKLKENTPVKNDDNDLSLLEDKIGEDLRYTLIMKQYESKLLESSEELFKNLIEKMISKHTESMRTFWKKQSEESERKALELRARRLQMVKQLRDNDNLSVLDKAKLDEKNCQIINKSTIDNMNRILEEQNKAASRFAAITDSRTKVCICYNDISNILNSEPHAKSIYDKYVMSINAVIGNINSIMELCKSGTITDKEVKQAEILSLNIENIHKKILEDLNEIKLKEEVLKKKEIEEQRMKKENEIKKLKEKVEQTNTKIEPNKTTPMFYSSKNYAYFVELRDFLNAYESNYKELLENANLKKFRFDCQKAVNTPVNALSSVSGAHIRDKFDKLYKLLRGERVQVLDTYVQATQHPQGLHYCTALLAKKIVRQGDLLVSSNPEAAYPLAAVAVALRAQFPEFGKLLEANFHRQCPYLVPMLLPQKEGQTDKEFYISRGYIYNEDGAVEKQDKFLKRMSGIFQLCCAIWIAKMPKFVNTSNPHGLCQGWKWLSSFINLKPEPDICATLLHVFFSVCGSEFYKNYKKQFVKIIKLVSTDYLKILENIDEGGPKTRLEVYLQNVLKTGQVPPPSGLLPPNTW